MKSENVFSNLRISWKIGLGGHRKCIKCVHASAVPEKHRKLEQATNQTHELHFTFSDYDKNEIGE